MFVESIVVPNPTDLQQAAMLNPADGHPFAMSYGRKCTAPNGALKRTQHKQTLRARHGFVDSLCTALGNNPYLIVHIGVLTAADV